MIFEVQFLSERLQKKEMFERKFDIIVTCKIRPDFRRKLKSGKYHLRLFIYKSPVEKKGYSTKIYVTKKEWEKINSLHTHPSVQLKKNEVIEIQAKAIQIIKELGDYFDFDDFEELMFGTIRKNRFDNTDVYATYQIKIDNLLKEERIGSAESYQRSMDSLKTYKKRLKFEDVTVDFLRGYERFMRRTNRNQTTIGIHLRSLRTIVNMAKSVGVVREKDYPFGRQANNKYEIPAPRSIKRALPLDDLAKIIRYEPDNNEIWARDMWMFSFYCNGMNMVDVFNLKWGNIKGRFLYFVREKTKLTCRNQVPIEVYVIDKAWEIIERWTFGNDRNEGNYIFGVFDEYMLAEEKYRANKIAIRIINSNMKKIANKLGVECSVSTFVARHTWATILMKNNVSMPYISKGLGHTSMTTTERYLGDFDQEQKIEIGKILSRLTNTPYDSIR